jgi:hypothetical protein
MAALEHELRNRRLHEGSGHASTPRSTSRSFGHGPKRLGGGLVLAPDQRRQTRSDHRRLVDRRLGDARRRTGGASGPRHAPLGRYFSPRLKYFFFAASV